MLLALATGSQSTKKPKPRVTNVFVILQKRHNQIFTLAVCIQDMWMMCGGYKREMVRQIQLFFLLVLIKKLTVIFDQFNSFNGWYLKVERAQHKDSNGLFYCHSHPPRLNSLLRCNLEVFAR